MGVITGGTIIEGVGLGSPLLNAGAPTTGVDEVWTLTIGGTPTAGETSTFTLTAGGVDVGPILWSATNTTLVTAVQEALDAATTVGSGNAVVAVGTMTAGVGTLTFTAAGAAASTPLGAAFYTVDSNDLTGTDPTAAVARTTTGVVGSLKGSPKGAKLIDVSNGVDYINTGTSLTPTWTKVGTQS